MYYLLPFRFERYHDKEILVNEAGDFLILPEGTALQIVERQITKENAIYKDLLSNFFISETPIPYLIDNLAVRLRTKKAFLDNFTTLHIFVLTLRCNQNCIYCQASSREVHDSMYDMSAENIQKAVNLMFHTPSPSITVEFQGGESTLAPGLLGYAIDLIEEKNTQYSKSITYVLCTNCVHLTDEILSICKKYNVLISTSLDGFEAIHNHNRGKTDSYAKVVSGIAKARKTLGFDRVSALMTTSEDSVYYPKEIVDAYIENGFSNIFIRALNPYGLASKYSDWNDYYDKFVDFYKKALDYIIEINKQGVYFVEEFTALILRKILTPFPIGFVDLQSPAGVVNNVVVYNYDGYVYASDESRMLAEHNDYTFRLGHVSEEYETVFYGKKVQDIAKIWVNEVLSGCSDCAFMGYCGADPVRNYSTQNDMYGIRPTSSFCRKYKEIIQHIFSLLIDRKEEVMPIFKQWINNSTG